MTDIHSGIPHDLPEYEPNTNPPKWRVQVFREPWGWGWTHQCDAKRSRAGHSYLAWRIAMSDANKHARRCW